MDKRTWGAWTIKNEFKMRTFLGVVVLICASSISDSQVRNFRPAKYDSYEWWTAQTDSTKIAYVRGFRQGMDLGAGLTRENPWSRMFDSVAYVAIDRYQTLKTEYFRGPSDEAFVNAIDKLYADPENRSIPTVFMFWISANSIPRNSSHIVEGMLREFRNRYRK